MSDFDEWFEINKVTSNKSPDMDGLKDLFEKCWNDCKNKLSDEFDNQIETLQDEVENLEYDNEMKDDEIENLKGCIIEIKNTVEESKTLKEAKEKVNDYDY